MEAEALENRERCVCGKAVNIHSAGLLNDVMRIVLLVDSYGNPVRRVCDLGNSIDDKAVVLFAVV